MASPLNKGAKIYKEAMVESQKRKAEKLAKGLKDAKGKKPKAKRISVDEYIKGGEK